jgi:hypothetical protein
MLFRIWNSSGDTYVEVVKKEDILKELQSGEVDETAFLSEIPRDDTNYWDDKFLLIEGKIVTPRPKTIVKTETWEI